MFEKEIEKHCNEAICSNCGHPREGEGNCGVVCHEWRDEYDTFKEGAEFGYNKANEWHRPSEKLPEECSLVLAYSFDDTEPSLWKFITSDQWEWLPKRIVFCRNYQIRLWKEIVLPKEIE